MEKTACPSSYVVVDLETTGLYPSQDRILEIGAVKVLDGEVADTFCMFADPQMKIRRDPGINGNYTGDGSRTADTGRSSACLSGFLRGTGSDGTQPDL